MEAKQEERRGQLYDDFREAVYLMEQGRLELRRYRLSAAARAMTMSARVMAQVVAGMDLSTGYPAGHPGRTAFTDVEMLDAGALRRRLGELQLNLWQLRRALALTGGPGTGLRYGVSVLWRRAREPARAAGIVLTVALASLPMVIYTTVSPQSGFDATGQLYWKTSTEKPFSETDSQRFTVPVDGTSREYLVSFDEPLSIAMLRIDPVNSPRVTAFDVESLELLSTDGHILQAHYPGKDRLWSCTNCTGPGDAGGAGFHPVNNDPYLTSPWLESQAVARIRIRMAAQARKTFWEWVLGLEAGGG